MRDGSRRVTKIVEVEGLEGDTITLSDLFEFDHSAGTDDEGKILGTINPRESGPSSSSASKSTATFSTPRSSAIPLKA